MNITVRPSTIAEIWHDKAFLGMLDAYEAECAVKGLPRTNAKRDLYQHLEAISCLSPIGAWADDALAGFCGVVSAVAPHYGRTLASVESLFVAKPYRKTDAGLRLLRAAETVARDLGCPGLLVSAPMGGTLNGVLAGRRYAPTNQTWFKGFVA